MQDEDQKAPDLPFAMATLDGNLIFGKDEDVLWSMQVRNLASYPQMTQFFKNTHSSLISSCIDKGLTFNFLVKHSESIKNLLCMFVILMMIGVILLVYGFE